jgi:sugar/nucleoside kinase (ribokinase family)
MKTYPLDVLTVGEAMALFVADTPGPLASVEKFTRTSAGAELNVAIGLSRLGLKVAYVSRVGQDLFGQFLINTLQAEGIDHQHVQVDAQHPTGFMLKSCELTGDDPKIEYFRKGSAASNMRLQDNPVDAFAQVRQLHVTGISVALSDSVRELVSHMVAQARSAGVQVSFDPNLRPRLWPSQAIMVQCLNAVAAQSHLVMPGLSEGQLLTGQHTPHDIAAYYLDHGARQVVIKLGPLGAYFATHTARGLVPGFQVERVVDTVGAGDGFAVGVLSALLDGQSLEEAALRGNAMGARVVQFRGDCEGLPNRDQLAQALAGKRVG